MAALLFENTKLIMLILLIGTIIGLCHFCSEPGRPAVRK
jgi:hypothetical protein